MAQPEQKSGDSPAQKTTGYQLPVIQTDLVVPPFDELTMQFFGIPGSGKTCFTGGDPYTMFCATEPGQQFIKAGVTKVRSWDGPEYHVDEKTGVVTMGFTRLVHTIAEQRKAGTLQYKSVTIDIVDNLHGYCQDAVCKRLNVPHPADGKYGKVWSAVTSP